MGIKPRRQVQPDFDPKLIGAVMSSYFGGRAEVHRRREIVAIGASLIQSVVFEGERRHGVSDIGVFHEALFRAERAREHGIALRGQERRHRGRQRQEW